MTNQSKEISQIYASLEARYFGEKMDERAEIQRLPELLRDVRSFVDIGSSLGQYAYFADKILADSDIFCIEPDPFKVRRLRELVADWQKTSTNRLHVIDKAVSDTMGSHTFFAPVNHRSSGGLFALEKPAEWSGRIESIVDCVTLDSLFPDLDVDLVKIDVEGGEFRVLSGASNILKAAQARFLVEVAPWGDLERGHKPSSVFRLMAHYGYDFMLIERLWLFYKARNQTAARLKARIIGYASDHTVARKVLKRVLKLRGIRGRGSSPQ